MKERNPRNAMSIWLPEAVIVIMAIVALRKDNPYSYYIFLRWVACPVLGWIAWKAYSRGSGIMMVIAAGVLAVLFNPLIRVMLDRDKWEILNIAMIAVAIWSVVVSVKPKQKET
jgi:glucose-6-phosphate-specific signal transduction histidine kinase